MLKDGRIKFECAKPGGGYFTVGRYGYVRTNWVCFSELKLVEQGIHLVEHIMEQGINAVFVVTLSVKNRILDFLIIIS